MTVSEERLQLWKEQGLENADVLTIEAALEARTQTIAAMWAGFIVIVSGGMAFASRQLAIALGGALIALLVYATLRLGARFRSEELATLTEKFITRKKRREFVVLGGRSFRVSRAMYDVMTPGARYRIHSNASGARVFDREPDVD